MQAGSIQTLGQGAGGGSALGTSARCRDQAPVHGKSKCEAVSPERDSYQEGGGHRGKRCRCKGVNLDVNLGSRWHRILEGKQKPG